MLREPKEGHRHEVVLPGCRQEGVLPGHRHEVVLPGHHRESEDRMLPGDPADDLEEADSGRDEKIDDFRKKEAELLAEQLHAMVAVDPETIEPKNEQARPIQYGDVAILFSVMTHVDIYEEALRKKSIPYHIVKGRGFYYKMEVMDILNVFQALVRPEDDVSFLSSLHSPMQSRLALTHRSA